MEALAQRLLAAPMRTNHMLNAGELDTIANTTDYANCFRQSCRDAVKSPRHQSADGAVRAELDYWLKKTAGAQKRQRAQHRQWAEEEAEAAARIVHGPSMVPSSRKGVVYAIDCPQYAKLRFSSNRVMQRLDVLKNGNSLDLIVYALVEGGRTRERSVPREFREWRHRFDWFKLTPGARCKRENTVIDLGVVVYDGKRAPLAADLFKKGGDHG